MPPNASANGPTNGIEPAHTHHDRFGAEARVQRAPRRVERGTVGIGLPRGRAFERAEPQLEAPRNVGLDVRAELVEHAVGLLSGCEPQAQARRRAGDDLVRRALDRVARRSRSRSATVGTTAARAAWCPGRRRAVRRAVRPSCARSRPDRRRGPSIGDPLVRGGRERTSSQRPAIARSPVLVDQRREHAGERHHGIGDRAAGHARVHRSVERAQLDVGRGEPA